MQPHGGEVHRVSLRPPLWAVEAQSVVVLLLHLQILQPLALRHRCNKRRVCLWLPSCTAWIAVLVSELEVTDVQRVAPNQILSKTMV